MEAVSQQIIEKITTDVSKKLFIEVEASGRHVHLCRRDVEMLFGEGYQLTRLKDLSQPGQYACRERVMVSGPYGCIENVIVLGPERDETQVEVSATDARSLGVQAVYRLSGDLDGTPGVVISSGDRQVEINQGVIVAKRHIHMHPDDADRFDIEDGESVSLKVFGERALTFDDVIVRIHESFRTYVHIDYDEANACGYQNKMLSMIVR